jgi:hypothetical protein
LTVFHEECARRAREALDADAFEAAQQEGDSLTFDEAVEYVLADG